MSWESIYAIMMLIFVRNRAILPFAALLGIKYEWDENAYLPTCKLARITITLNSSSNF